MLWLKQYLLIVIYHASPPHKKGKWWYTVSLKSWESEAHQFSHASEPPSVANMSAPW